MSPRSIVIDCDPGQDDAVALLMALASPDKLEVLAVTTVAGNVPLDRIVGNARRIVELAGRRDVPVHAGCPGPSWARWSRPRRCTARPASTA